MTDNATVTKYRDELIEGYEQGVSLLVNTVLTDGQANGLSYVFDVVDSNTGEAVSRGLDGFIPATTNNDTQSTCTLVEWHDLRRKTRFNIFTSQGSSQQAKTMQDMTIKVINRRRDKDILVQLATGTVNTGAAVTASPQLVLKAQTILQNAEVPWDMNVTCVITPAFNAYLKMSTEFSNIQYVNGKPWESGDPNWRDKPYAYMWEGIMFIVHPRLTGKGTNAEKCFMYHKSAVGSAFDSSGMDVDMGYNGEQQYTWARSSIFTGSKLLQNAGIVVINHDGSALVAG